MSYREAYESWLSNPYFDEDTKEELRSIANDEKEIEDRFYMDLEFGTAGLRGVIGAGTNRMNVYTVRKATQGLANYIIKVGAQAKGVAIAYDSRRMSRNLQMKQLYVWQRTVSKHTFSRAFVRLRSCLMQSVTWDVQPESM